MKIKYGPYLRSDGRKQVDVLQTNGSTKSMLYSRYVMQNHLGRELSSSEHVDHIDSNPLNDDLCNLQLITKSENAAKDVVRKAPDGTLYKNSGANITKGELLNRSGALHLGKKNSQWLSYIETPYGTFESLRLAARAEGIHHSTLDKRLKSKNFPKYIRTK